MTSFAQWVFFSRTLTETEVRGYAQIEKECLDMGETITLSGRASKFPALDRSKTSGTTDQPERS